MPRAPIGPFQLLVKNIIVTLPRLIKHEAILELWVSVQDCLVICRLAPHRVQHILETLQELLSFVRGNSELDDVCNWHESVRLSRRIELVVSNYFPSGGEDDEFKALSKNAIAVRREHLPIEGYDVTLLASAGYCSEVIASIAHELVVRFANAPLKVPIPDYLSRLDVVFPLGNPQLRDSPPSLFRIPLVPHRHVSISKLVQIHLKAPNSMTPFGESVSRSPRWT
jgi:hypothetical protein